MKNGKGKLRVAIVGVGNCASSFVQGVQHYRDASPGGAGKLPRVDATFTGSATAV